jgi:pilus assembly protein CpaB
VENTTSLTKRIFASRGGTLAVGVIAAVLAAIALLVYLNQYRNNLNKQNASVGVLVAKNLIPKGTPGSQIGTKVLFQATSVPRSQLKTGALSDPAALRNLVAVADIYPGQQLTLGSFGAARVGALADQLTNTERAIAVPVDSVHGLVGQIQAGDRVDIMLGVGVSGSSRVSASGAIIKTIFQNVLVLSTTPGSLTLRLRDAQAERMAWAADNGKLWMILRPAVAAKDTQPKIITFDSVILGATK